LSVIFAFLLAFGTFLWAAALSRASIHGLSFLVGVAVMLAPATMLRSVVQDEVATITSLGRSEAALIISVFSLFLEGVRSSALWTAKIRILNSRWRLLSYGTILQSCSHFCAFLSPFVCEFLARQQKSRHSAVWQLDPCNHAQPMPAVLSKAWRDVHHAQSEGAGRCDDPVRCPSGLGAVLSAGRHRPIHQEGHGHFCRSRTELEERAAKISEGHLSVCIYYLRRCRPGSWCALGHLAQDTEAVFGQHYGLNRFRQNTTGMYNCLSRTRAVGGDTFRFWEFGRCEVALPTPSKTALFN
ncbi:mok11, partial [Symbiodinium necroappetens]